MERDINMVLFNHKDICIFVSCSAANNTFANINKNS